MKPLETAEKQLRNKLEAEGWKVIHKGWPDFACIRDGEMIFVEVKNYRGEMLKEEQHYMLTNLAKLGLNCYKWTPDGEFEQITPSTPMPIIKKNTEGGIRRRLTYEEKFARLSPEEKKLERKLIEEDEAKVKFGIPN